MLHNQMSAAVEKLLAEIGLVHQVTEHLKLEREIEQVVVETVAAILFCNATARFVCQQALARALFTPTIRQQRRYMVIVDAHDRRFGEVINNLPRNLLRGNADRIEFTAFNSSTHKLRHCILRCLDGQEARWVLRMGEAALLRSDRP